MTLTGLNETVYRLSDAPIGSGGEGDIYAVRGMDYVAKIYKVGALSTEIMEKIRIMIEHPPNTSVLSQVAWPLDMAYDESGQCRGFVMPKLNINAELSEVYKYPATLQISAQQKINIAQNICVVISEVHRAGYVFGDFNPRNIGLDVNTGLVSFLDTDTYHVTDHTAGKTYRCNVCAPGYTAPELLDKCSDYIAVNPNASKNAYAQTPLPTFTKETDNFALAIHIFKLLMNGYTPFGGIIETASVSQASPGVGDAAVRRNSYCFRPGYKPQSVAIPVLETLPQEIVDLFTRAFIKGKVSPQARPSAIEWHDALTKFVKQLVTCPHNQLHQYDRKNSDCPLCEADRRFGAVVTKTSREKTLTQAIYDPPPEVAQPKGAKPFVTGYQQYTQASAYVAGYHQSSQTAITGSSQILTIPPHLISTLSSAANPVRVSLSTSKFPSKLQASNTNAQINQTLHTAETEREIEHLEKKLRLIRRITLIVIAVFATMSSLLLVLAFNDVNIFWPTFFLLTLAMSAALTMIIFKYRIRRELNMRKRK